MPNSSNRGFRRGQEEKGRIGKITEKSKSFHGQAPATPALLRRPKTQPDLYSFRNTAGVSPAPVVEAPRLTRLLLNVTVQRSLGPVQVLLPPDATVGDLVRETVRSYGREGRRPLLPTADPAGFDLHYSQFSLESLDSKEKLIGLGSRNFFLCPKPLGCVMDSCSNQAQKASSKTGGPSWLRFMDFMR
ncbi:hypothetical protein CKAN_01109500 [Cinnamomum micranthum f. kanehirae]|uniref:DUF7054 domain-containing protein n=1 Tax=Cinnamomum micranthum f. kanehirae TaxID=337451 RepID=A0A443NV43_9MAGN|nr:hypothetical protein CKAN_01109500 [Cinnamomum micranthum f. kanehirae]